ncbi:hypothetical protein Tcan_13440 [Toxocara canis]|uniref:Uncharacterized protein n=1 Tax=Toxocara canis TaxID=6265 RepID=A0A0B2W0Q2_TOXCA|nr:hypothetical protein Tcan_13440 [Toxocara canis]
MRQYVLVIIIVVGFLLFTSIVISLCIIFCKSNRFRRPRRVSTTMRVQPSSATPISVLEMAPKQSFVHLPPPSYEKYDMRTRSLAPSVRAYSNDYSFDRELFKDVNDVNWSAQPERSLSTVTARSAGISRAYIDETNR